MSGGDLALELARIARRRAAGLPPAARARPRERRSAPARADVCALREDAGEESLRIRSALARLREAGEVDHGLAPAAGHELSEIAFLDLETTGFWGCPIFLVGLLLEEDGRLVTLQLLARDYPEEERILRAAARALEGKRLLVTFNGKSYDVPCFRERALLHGVRHAVDELDHVDVLHPARRRFREELPDCRLATLEREVVGVFRTDDVPSRDVPAVYHAYAATGDDAALAPVLRHSRVDLLSTARLFAELAAPERSRPGAARTQSALAPSGGSRAPAGGALRAWRRPGGSTNV